MRRMPMQKGGISTAILGTIAFVILAILAFMVVERPMPQDSDRDSAQVEAQLMAFELELERDRLALESLRLRAQIQADLAAIDARLAAAAEQRAGDFDGGFGAGEGFVEDDFAAEPEFELEFEPEFEFEPEQEQEFQMVSYLPDGASNALPAFEPDPMAYEEFSEPLEPYGEWYETDDYGPIWQPDPVYVEDSWAPYTNGSWGYSNYGWNWESNDPFGWACDHYGRWLYISRHGWVWVPGSQWAPAWVSWRTCDRYVGWAPLPPCATWNSAVGIGSWVDGYCDIGPSHYNFVERGDFGAPDCRSSILDRSRNAGLIAGSRNVTRLHGDKRGIKNDGPDYDEARRRSSQRIRKRTIDIAAETRGTREQVAMGRTNRQAERRLERIPAARRESGWDGVGDRDEALRLRKQVVTQARGSLLDQDRPATTRRPSRGRTLTAITSRPQRNSTAIASLPTPSTTSVEVVQVGAPPAMRTADRGGRGTPTRTESAAPAGARAVVVAEQPLPDHFAAERARREASFARQQAAIDERDRLAQDRQSKEIAAQQRIESQINRRRRTITAAGRGGDSSRRGGEIAAPAPHTSPSLAQNDPNDPSRETPHGAGQSFDPSRPSGGTDSIARSRSGRSDRSGGAGGRFAPNDPSSAPEPSLPTRNPAAGRRASQPSRSIGSARSIARTDAISDRRSTAIPTPRRSVGPQRQQKHTSQPQRQATSSRQAASPRSQPSAQPSRSRSETSSQSRQQKQTERPSPSGSGRDDNNRRRR